MAVYALAMLGILCLATCVLGIVLLASNTLSVSDSVSSQAKFLHSHMGGEADTPAFFVRLFEERETLAAQPADHMEAGAVEASTVQASTVEVSAETAETAEALESTSDLMDSDAHARTPIAA